MGSRALHTVTGPALAGELGLILPHEHLFTDLRGPQAPGYAVGDPDAVAGVMEPYLRAAQSAGVTALVECSTLGVGRNTAVLKKLAALTPIRIVAPTGVYRDAYIPDDLRGIGAEALADLWIGDLLSGIDGSGARAGFIKIAMSDDGPTRLEVRNLQAAARASLATGAAIASHTINPESARQEMDILEQEGLDLHRFIWVHANVQASPAQHLQAARRGAYLEFDTVGSPGPDQDKILAYTQVLVEAGFTSQILLSHDAGWYDPSQPGGRPAGNGIRGYTALVDHFIPAMKTTGLPEATIHQITWTNPFEAFAIKERDYDQS